jgi:hypothetical protein
MADLTAEPKPIRWVRCPEESCGFEYVVDEDQPFDPHPTCDGSALPKSSKDSHHQEMPMEVINLTHAEFANQLQETLRMVQGLLRDSLTDNAGGPALKPGSEGKIIEAEYVCSTGAQDKESK